MIRKQWTEKDMEGGCGDVILVPNPDIFLEELRKTTKDQRTASVWAETWTQDLPNKNEL
jgi:hypothetical protein